MATPFFAIDFKLPNGEPRPFRWETADDMLAWLQKERETWQWLSVPGAWAHDEQFNPQEIRDLHRMLMGQFDSIVSSVNSARVQSNRINEVTTTFQNLFLSHRLPFRDSLAAVKLSKLAQKDPVHGGYALKCLLNNQGHIWTSHRPGFVGGVEAALISLGIVPEHTKHEAASAEFAHLREEVKAYRAKMADEREAARKELEALGADRAAYKKEAAEALTAAKVAADAALKASSESFSKEFDAWKSQVETARKEAADSLTALDKSLRTVHVLKGAREYWHNVAVNSEKAAKPTYKALLWWLWAGSSGTLAVFIASLWLLKDALGPWAYFPGLIVSLPVIWISRINARLYLSEKHRERDAHERVTMIDTYEALLRESKLPDADERRLILTSIFRPGASGLVKDDMAPMIGWASLVSKVKEP